MRRFSFSYRLVFSRFQDGHHQRKGLQRCHQTVGRAQAHGLPGGSARHRIDSQLAGLSRQVARIPFLQALVGQWIADKFR